ncbi:hypothetical protein COCSUDRAFT_55044 [Coccomyxa subellipsoidea C-169]|uniref:SGNH hydrolase-type esterase domain-containing protein n=1 Tax=Coccomyxa subellipsoidea (strain C-169) TaxID=574566 RepID=I0YI21_COCSC|nr:hypothetical protein COCSUDRAFT_55044 [Coccomyxa subellipsoidea C-169]EIE18040.1 hypothetical protein COCSUDRAFT_55044 [Coccomyxa subellipsoidea C-169]|eukprot:XP_005642584.1 hypothetical protein COCSUDRAFT_55044 [Coccomyxa subellipsoidea C-169]
MGSLKLFASTVSLLIVVYGTAVRAARLRCGEKGSQPGYWSTVRLASDFFMWQTLDPTCPLVDCISNYLESEHQVPFPTILIFGDSVDRFLIDDFHQVVDDKVDMPEAKKVALKSKFTRHHTPGVSLEGPYHLNEVLPKSPQMVIDEAKRSFESLAQVPDVVVFNANLWDIGRLWAWDRGTFSHDHLDESFSRDWLRNGSHILQLIQVSFASSVLIAHTTALPALESCDTDRHAQAPTGRRTHVVQLNALLRELVLQNPRWHLVDVELLTLHFWPVDKYLRDTHHPLPFVTMNMLNVYLNLYLDYV